MIFTYGFVCELCNYKTGCIEPAFVFITPSYDRWSFIEELEG